MIVVTGAAGFIGSNLVAALNAAGHDRIVMVDWLGSAAKWRNIIGLRYLDFLAPDDLPAFLDANAAAIETVYHLGANSATTASDGDEILRTNLRPSMQLWRWCAAHGRTFIYASSAATYGDGELGFDDELGLDEMARLRPMNLYAWSKHAFDMWALQRAAEGAAPPRWAGLKFFNVYGPREHHKGFMMSVVAKYYPPLKRGEAIPLFRSHRPDFRDGEQLRDFVYVKDCADVMLWMRTAPRLSGIFNVGSGKARSFRDLITAAAAALHTSPRIEYVDMPPDIRDKYQYFTEARMNRLAAAGYNQPFHSVEAGVGDYIRLLESGEALAAPPA